MVKKTPRQLEGWQTTIDAVRAKFPNLTYKEAMIKASPIYHEAKKRMGLGKKKMGLSKKQKGGLNMGDVWQGIQKYGPPVATGISIARTLASLL